MRRGDIYPVLAERVCGSCRHHRHALAVLSVSSWWPTGVPHTVAMFGAMAFGLAIRLLALRFNWHMPKFVYTQDLH